MMRLTFTRPDDAHVHLRDGAVLSAVAADTASRFARAVIMPNLKPSILTTADAAAYRRRILAALPSDTLFQPLMTLYLTEKTPGEEIVRAKESGIVHGVKLYPAGATTHSEEGVHNIVACDEIFTVMEAMDMPLLIHGEVTDRHVDVFDRERVFIEKHLISLTERFPNLRVVLEHITTRFAADFVRSAPDNVAATITAHHLLLNRNAMFEGGIRPHSYCLPLLKREDDRCALIEAAVSGNPKFFLGTDSAPHSSKRKEASCGCAGIYTSHAALELYAEIFEEENALNRLEAFASFFAADFYKIPRNVGQITLEKRAWEIPLSIPFVEDTLVPFRAGTSINWKIVSD